MTGYLHPHHQPPLPPLPPRIPRHRAHPPDLSPTSSPSPPTVQDENLRLSNTSAHLAAPSPDLEKLRQLRAEIQSGLHPIYKPIPISHPYKPKIATTNMSLKQHTASSQHYISDFKPHSLTHSSSSDPTDGHHARSVHPTESQPTKADHSDLISTSTPPIHQPIPTDHVKLTQFDELARMGTNTNASAYQPNGTLPPPPPPPPLPPPERGEIEEGERTSVRERDWHRAPSVDSSRSRRTRSVDDRDRDRRPILEPANPQAYRSHWPRRRTRSPSIAGSSVNDSRSRGARRGSRRYPDDPWIPPLDDRRDRDRRESDRRDYDRREERWRGNGREHYAPDPRMRVERDPRLRGPEPSRDERSEDVRADWRRSDTDRQPRPSLREREEHERRKSRPSIRPGTPPLRAPLSRERLDEPRRDHRRGASPDVERTRRLPAPRAAEREPLAKERVDKERARLSGRSSAGSEVDDYDSEVEQRRYEAEVARYKVELEIYERKMAERAVEEERRKRRADEQSRVLPDLPLEEVRTRGMTTLRIEDGPLGDEVVEVETETAAAAAVLLGLGMVRAPMRLVEEVLPVPPLVEEPSVADEKTGLVQPDLRSISFKKIVKAPMAQQPQSQLPQETRKVSRNRSLGQHYSPPPLGRKRRDVE